VTGVSYRGSCALRDNDASFEPTANTEEARDALPEPTSWWDGPWPSFTQSTSRNQALAASSRSLIFDAGAEAVRGSTLANLCAQ